MSNGGTGRQYHTQQTHYIAVTVEGSDGAQTLDVGKIPKGSFIIGAGIVVGTALNGAATVSMGPSADPDGFASAVSIASTGLKPADDLATSNDLYAADEITIQATVGGNPTAGKAMVFVEYIPDNRS